jgi:diguanylate cyclase (GGDEF)-like protein
VRNQAIKRRFFLLSAALLFIYVILIISIISVFEHSKETYIKTQFDDVTHQIDATYINYENYVNFVYHHILSDTNIIDTMESVSSATEQEKDNLRIALHDELSPIYEEVLDNNIKQIQVHLPDGTSFLRMHATTLYGDNLNSIRPTILNVSTTQTFSKGFEIGKTYTGYRYVFPLFKNNIFLGSIELSLSTTTLVETLYTLKPNTDFLFILKIDAVDAISNSNYLQNYSASSINNDYYVEQIILDNFDARRILFSRDEYTVIFTKNQDVIESDILIEDDFYATYRVDDKNYSIYFISVKDSSDAHVGYLIMITENLIVDELNFQMIFALVIFTMLTISLSLFIYFMTKDKLKLETLSSKDALTEISNRYFFKQTAVSEFDKAKRYQTQLSLIMIDIDHFKQINDTYGHKTGDIILKELANLIKENIRKVDLIARWGGEEFVIILPETPLTKAFIASEKIRTLVESHTFYKAIQLTISLGVAAYLPDYQSIEELIDDADIALYEAKNAGRNVSITYKK